MVITTRNQWMDVAKGFSIILMILGHTSIPDSFSRLIYSFHMPLFFIASGWMTDWSKYSFSEYFSKKISTLVIPFFIYSTIVLILMVFIHGGGYFINWMTNGWQGYALWFIPVLFLATLLVRILYLIQKIWLRVLASLCLLFAGIALSYYNITLPWSISVVPYACFMIISGTYLKKYQSYINDPKWFILLSGLVIAFIVSRFWKLDMAWNNIIPVIPLTIGAMAGTAMIFTFASMVVKYQSKISLIFQFIGRETFAIVAFSQIIIILCNEYLTTNPVLKYMILLISLWAIIYIKNKIQSLIMTL